MYTVDFLGIIYFDLCNTTQTSALVPNGTKAVDGMPPHHPALFVAVDDHVVDDWWTELKREHSIAVRTGITTTETVRFLEFRVDQRVELTFDCSAGAVDTTNVEAALVSLAQVDDQFQADPNGAIATIPIPGGTLNAFGFGRATAVRWIMDKHADPIVIAASDGKVIRRITLSTKGQNPIEIVFSNTPDLLAKRRERKPHAHAPEHDHGSDEECGHFELYGKINKGPNGASKLKCPDVNSSMRLPPLLTRNPYLRVLTAGEQIPNSNCSPTCC